MSYFWTAPICVYKIVYQHLNKTIPFQFFFLDFCIDYIFIKLDAKYYYNVTSYKSFINKVYDLVGQPSYKRNKSDKNDCQSEIDYPDLTVPKSTMW